MAHCHGNPLNKIDSKEIFLMLSCSEALVQRSCLLNGPSASSCCPLSNIKNPEQFRFTQHIRKHTFIPFSTFKLVSGDCSRPEVWWPACSTVESSPAWRKKGNPSSHCLFILGDPWAARTEAWQAPPQIHQASVWLVILLLGKSNVRILRCKLKKHLMGMQTLHFSMLD